MATVTIELCDDDGDAGVGVVLTFEPEFDANSPAHVMAVEIANDLQQASADAVEELAEKRLRAGLFAPRKKGQCDD